MTTKSFIGTNAAPVIASGAKQSTTANPVIASGAKQSTTAKGRIASRLTAFAMTFIAAMVLGLAGCDKSPEVQVLETPDWSNLRFVVSATNVDGLNVGGLKAQGARTRALKTGWADGDKIIAYFTPDAANWVTLQYDLETDEWSAIAAQTNVGSGIAASGNAVKALHSGKGVERENSGVLNVDTDTDLLYDDAGEYTQTARSIWSTTTAPSAALVAASANSTAAARTAFNAQITEKSGTALGGSGNPVNRWYLSSTESSADRTVSLYFEEGLHSNDRKGVDGNIRWIREL